VRGGTVRHGMAGSGASNASLGGTSGLVVRSGQTEHHDQSDALPDRQYRQLLVHHRSGSDSVKRRRKSVSYDAGETGKRARGSRTGTLSKAAADRSQTFHALMERAIVRPFVCGVLDPARPEPSFREPLRNPLKTD